jgi:cytochrome o ubiquinol oxidase subunit 2
MGKQHKILLLLILALGVLLLWPHNAHAAVAVLEPKGIIALKERNLMLITVLLGLLVIIPVFIMTFMIAWKYRATNTRAKYQPNWDHNLVAESIWWGIPCVIILILATLTWHSSHDLDPFKPLDSSVKPITIQVVALQWKWLFIYPEQGIATVNYVQFPKATPVNFQITADAPMNSFWIPQLGGQIYAMAGMNTQLHLMADGAGSYAGSSANISGAGFADMHFTAQSTSQSDFNRWVQSVKRSPAALTARTYKALALPSSEVALAAYALKDENLYDDIIMKYMMPASEHSAHAMQ